MGLSHTTSHFSLDFPNDKWSGIIHYFHGFSEFDVKVPVDLNKNFVGLAFNLSGGFGYLIEDGLLRNLPKLHFCLVNVPAGHWKLGLDMGKHSIFCMEFTPVYLGVLQQCFPAIHDILRPSVKPAEPIFSDHYPINSAMLHDIRVTMLDERESPLTNAFKGCRYRLISMDCLNQIVASNRIGQSHMEKIRQAHDYLIKNIHFQCTVDLLASKVDLKPRKLEEGFKALYGTTVYKMLTDERMKRAMLLLRDTNATVNEVAESVGYNNSRIFYKTFRRHFGYPPVKLRKKGGE